ncbi:MAG: DUF6263 family protein [Gemmatimonadaceae bacterium]
MPDHRESSSARRAWLRAACVALACAALSGLARAGAAQAASAEGIVLRLHPRVGDTLRTRLEQVTEIASAQAGGGPARPMTTRVTVLARTIVQASRQATTTVFTIVDSAEVHSSDAHGAAMSAQAEKALRAQRMIVELAEDGSVEHARDARGVAVPRDVANAMAAMPAVLPRRPIAVGERWQREMPIPSAGPIGSGNAQVRAEFRLDSLSGNGEVAFVSMRGQIASDAGARGVDMSGSMSGAMQIDRVRGWMTDSFFTLLIRSVVTPPNGVGMQPMKFVTKVTQRLRTMDKR